MKHVFTLFMMMLAGLALTSAAFAAEKAIGAPVSDDFGGAYFTQSTPDALMEGGEDMFSADFSAEALSNIEPAAGGDAGFILPEDAADEATKALQDDRLEAPEEPLVPGMD